MRAFLRLLVCCLLPAFAPGLLRADGLPPPVTLELDRQRLTAWLPERSKSEAGVRKSDIRPLTSDLRLPLPGAASDVNSPRLSIGDSPAELFRANNDAFVQSLVNRGDANVQNVRTLSIPNPLASIPNAVSLLGSVSQWHGRFRTAFGSNFDGQSLIHGQFLIDSGLPFGIDTEFNYRQDKRPVLANRRFWNGDANVVYHLKQIRYVMFRIGVGVNWLDDGVTTTDVGFNTTYGLDVRLKKPWFLTTYLDYGTLGSDSLLHWHVSGGLDFGRFELFVGYDFFEVGTRERKNLLAGVGLWY